MRLQEQYGPCLTYHSAQEPRLSMESSISIVAPTASPREVSVDRVREYRDSTAAA